MTPEQEAELMRYHQAIGLITQLTVLCSKPIEDLSIRNDLIDLRRKIEADHDRARRELRF